MTVASSPSTSSNIACDTQHFNQNPIAQSQYPAYQVSVIPRTCLPDPPSLYPSLIAIGAEERVARQMDRAYIARALEFRMHFEKYINNAFTDFTFPRDWEKRILDTFANLYLTKVKSWIEDGVAVYKNSRKPAKQAVSEDGLSRSTNLRRAFNTDYVPFLEHFFDENPLPSHADKVFLARKSGMTYRQIHVWFQNRRNRTKKPNGTWRKKPTCEGATLPLIDLRERMGKHTIHNVQSPSLPLEAHRSSHSNQLKSVQEKRSSETLPRRMSPPAKDDNVLDRCTAPPHAFPSPYPPVCAYEPFPLESRGQMFAAFQWRRRPNHNTSSQFLKLDVNDLVDRFALLSVRDVYCKRSQRHCGGIQASLTATCFITITPPPAPHPSLIKPTKVVSSLARWSPLPIVRVSHSTSHIFVRSTASPVRILPPSHSENVILSRRKVSPLPKRCLPYPPLPCRNVTPGTSDVSSSTPSPCSSLRSLSDSFDFGTETLSPAPFPGPLAPQLSSPEPQTCPAAQEVPQSP